MATVVGTVASVILIQGPYAGPDQSAVRKTYLLGINSAIYTASADSVVATGVAARIGEHTKSGRTVTLRTFAAGPPGQTAAGAAAFANPAGTITNSSGTLSFQLGATQDTNTAAATGVGLYVIVDETVAA